MIKGKFHLNKKKLIQLTATTTLLASSYVAVSPIQAEAATSTESLVMQAESNVVLLKRAISVDYEADAVTQPWTEYNKAKKAYETAKAAVNKLSGTQKTTLNARLDNVKLWIDRTAVYIDSITSGKKLLAAQEAMENHLYEGEMEEATLSYHKLSYEIKKQAAYLYKVYGQSTRQAILETYKLPAEEAKAAALYPVSIHIELGRLQAALENNDTEKADILMANIDDWLYYVEDPVLFDTLTETYTSIYETYYKPNIVEVDSFPYWNEIPTGLGGDEFNILDMFAFYDDNGDMAWITPSEYGFKVRDNKGYFNVDGTLTTTYTYGLTEAEIGSVEVEVLDSSNKVVATNTFQIVDGNKLFSLDAGKLVDDQGVEASILTVGKNYQFVPTDAQTVKGDYTSEIERNVTLEEFPGATFRSSKPSIFTVDSTGNVTAVAPGYARLIVSWNDYEFEMMLKVNE